MREPREKVLRIVIQAKLGETQTATKTLLDLSYVNARVLDALRATRLAPELVAEQEKYDATVELRLVAMEPLSWSFTPLALMMVVPSLGSAPEGASAPPRGSGC